MSTHLGKTDAPHAQRASTSGWRDPRLWIGIALVAASVLIGARVLGTADDMTKVWAVRSDLAAGQTLGEDDLVVRNVRFADEQEADRYVLVAGGLPDEAVLQRGIGSGELLPVSALGARGAELEEVPLSAPAANIPSTLTRGSTIDVYVVPQRTGAAGAPPRATKVLDDVVVIAVPERDEVVGQVGNRQILVGVPAGADDQIGIVLAAARDNRIQFTRQG